MSNPNSSERSSAKLHAEIVPIFAALGDSTRLELVARLGSGEARSIVQLAAGLGITHQGVTKHLRVLEQAGLVTATKRGREKQYQCAPTPLAEARTYLEQVSVQWDTALLRLKKLVEE